MMLEIKVTDRGDVHVCAEGDCFDFMAGITLMLKAAKQTLIDSFSFKDEEADDLIDKALTFARTDEATLRKEAVKRLDDLEMLIRKLRGL